MFLTVTKLHTVCPVHADRKNKKLHNVYLKSFLIKCHYVAIYTRTHPMGRAHLSIRSSRASAHVK